MQPIRRLGKLESRPLYKSGPQYTPLGNPDAPVCDVAECCGICRADPKCAGAYVFHGPAHSAAQCFCELYNATEVARGTTTSKQKYPTQEIWVVPTRM